MTSSNSTTQHQFNTTYFLSLNMFQATIVQHMHCVPVQSQNLLYFNLFSLENIIHPFKFQTIIFLSTYASLSDTSDVSCLPPSFMCILNKEHPLCLSGCNASDVITYMLFTLLSAHQI